MKILLADGESHFSLKVLRCLGNVPDLRVVILSRDKHSPTRFSRYCSEFYYHLVDSFDENRLDEILWVANKVKAEVILPVDELTIKMLAKYHQRVSPLGKFPPIGTPESIDLAGNKWNLAKLLIQNGIPMPDTLFYDSCDFDYGRIDSLKYPVLTKQLNKCGGAGIVKHDSRKFLLGYLDKIDPGSKLLIQRYVNGYDIGSGVLCRDGNILAYVIQKGYIPGKKNFSPPAGIEFIYDENVFSIISRLIKIINWSGIAFIDMTYDQTDQIPKVLEINTRYWASIQGSLVAGVNFPYLACLSAADLAFDLPDYKFTRFVYTNQIYSLLVKKYLSFKTYEVPRFRNTGLYFSVKDPLPELIRHIY